MTPELVKRVGVVVEERILELFKEVWLSGVVPREWVDLTVCDNWHGISLLDVFGKLFARIAATAECS